MSFTGISQETSTRSTPGWRERAPAYQKPAAEAAMNSRGPIRWMSVCMRVDPVLPGAGGLASRAPRRPDFRSQLLRTGHPAACRDSPAKRASHGQGENNSQSIFFQYVQIRRAAGNGRRHQLLAETQLGGERVSPRQALLRAGRGRHAGQGGRGGVGVAAGPRRMAASLRADRFGGAPVEVGELRAVPERISTPCSPAARSSRRFPS